MVPCQNTGTERPRSVPTRVTLSTAWSRRIAEMMPATPPSASAKAIANTVSSRVTGSRSRISATTGLPVRHDVPKSPCTSRPSQRAYCRYQG